MLWRSLIKSEPKVGTKTEELDLLIKKKKGKKDSKKEKKTPTVSDTGIQRSESLSRNAEHSKVECSATYGTQQHHQVYWNRNDVHSQECYTRWRCTQGKMASSMCATKKKKHTHRVCFFFQQGHVSIVFS